MARAIIRHADKDGTPHTASSIHAPLAGRDLSCVSVLEFIAQFLSTRPLRGATRHGEPISTRWQSFYPRAPCGARREHFCGAGDAGDFYPRTPCGVRPCRAVPMAKRELFLPTHPLRGATFQSLPFSHLKFIFLPTHPLRGATPVAIADVAVQAISTHAPLAGCDGCCARRTQIYAPFLPTHPLRGATHAFDAP